MIVMRTAVIALSAAALLTLSACGGDDSDAAKDTTGGDGGLSMTRLEPTDTASSSAPTSSAPADPGAAESTVEDVQAYAPALEQAFFGSGYPKDLAGALSAAKKLTNLKLSPGNTIATYTFDPATSEFQLCIENKGGASATYDTEPMSTVKTTTTGGCP